MIQFEDFKNPFPALERYRDKYTCFNDDIQGTGAVILAGFMTAVKATGIPVRDHRAVFLGAGSAGVGVARQLVEFFVKEGLTEDEARRCFWLVDSNGLVTDDRGDKLAAHKTYFSRDDNAGKQIQSLARLIAFVEPTILMGLSTIGGAFQQGRFAAHGQVESEPHRLSVEQSELQVRVHVSGCGRAHGGTGAVCQRESVSGDGVWWEDVDAWAGYVFPCLHISPFSSEFGLSRFTPSIRS